MRDLIRFNWRAFDTLAGIKVSGGLIVMLVLTNLTGETWLATALVAMFAWLTNVPGPLKNRIGGMLAFALGAVAITLILGQLGLAVWPNVVAVAVVGFLCTAALAWGTRAFMVGWSLICWIIYAPFLIDATSVENCILAVLAGTGILVALNAVSAVFEREDEPDPANAAPAAKPDAGFVVSYAITVALVLAVTTYYGWVELKTDPTLMAGGAFFVLGFDAIKTWVAGISRVIGLAAGVALGLLLASLLGQGLVLDVLMIAACGLSFATVAVHPGGWMFFFMVFVAMGWPSLESATFDLTVKDRFYGETLGVLTAMVAIVFLQWWQNRRRG